MMLQRVMAASVLVLASAVVSNAQSEATPSSPSPKLVASIAKSVYKVGEAVEVTVTLENVGKESFYVPKELGGGYDDVGFELYLLRNGEPYCVVSVQYNCLGKKHKRQSVEQLLSDHFLLLRPGRLVGLHTWLRTTSCLPGIPALAPGKYAVSAAYSGMGDCVPDLSNKRTQFPILQSRVKGVRMQFELTE
jgi:hypothetical protein